MSNTQSVKIGRFNEATKTVRIKKGDTITDILGKAKINLSSSEKCWIDGEVAKITDKVKNNQIIQVVGKKSNGNKKPKSTESTTTEEDEPSSSAEPIDPGDEPLDSAEPTPEV